MNRLALSVAALATLACAPAHAALTFLPHMGEYGKAVPGQYAGLALYHADYNSYYGRDEAEFTQSDGGAGINSVFIASAWVGNLFRDTDIPLLSSRTQICALGFPVAQVQARGSIRTTAEAIGVSSGKNGIGDVIGSCTIQDVTRVLGPARGHVQFTGLVKFPIGDYDPNALYNFATNYWTYVPQLSLHADITKLVVDATVAYQFNGNNDDPFARGDVPTRPADWENAAINLGWKLSYRWWIDVGFAYNKTNGVKYYDKFHVQPAHQSVLFSAVCGGFPSLCNATGTGYIETRQGPYEDGGMMSQVVSASVYYTYRSSLIVNFRVAEAIAGRGSQFTAYYDVCTQTPCDQNAPSKLPNSPFSFTAIGVGESASVVSQPFYELRFIFPLAAF